MITLFFSLLSIVVVVTTASILYYQSKRLRHDTHTKMQGLVDQINDSQYYEYRFDKKQEQNIKNLDRNVNMLYANVTSLHNNVKGLERNAVQKKDIKNSVQTNLLDADKAKMKRVTVANNTASNNIVIEGGRTSDGKNEGWSALNFNGYHEDGDKRINANKSRWRMVSDQRSTTDALGIDQLDKNNQLWNYIWMTDGTVGVNNNKLRFSNKWTGYPDKSTDQAEISNDASSFKKLMIVGNKSSGENIRKVGIWDRLDVHGNQGVDGTLSAQNVQGRDSLTVGNSASWMRNDGQAHIGNNLNVQNKLFFKDPSLSTTGNNNNNTDPYYLEKVVNGGNSHLRLTINDDADESFQIWGDSCRSAGGCPGPGAMRHSFTADGSAYHYGTVTADAVKANKQICVDNVCLTKDDIVKLKK